MKPFRFGVNVRTAGSRTEWADKARKIEALGYAAGISYYTVQEPYLDTFAPVVARLAGK